MIDVFTKVVLAGACLFTFAWVILAQRRIIRRLSDAYLRLTHFQRVVVVLTVIVCTVYAQKPSTNDVEGVSGTNGVEIVEGGGTNGVDGTSGEAVSSPLLLGFVRPLTSGQESASPFSAPYRLESISTNEGYSYAKPADGAIRGTWQLTGAYEDVQKVTLDGFAFPFGSDLCTSLWAYTWGNVRPQLKNASNEIAAVGAPMSAIPVVSRFWTAATSNDTYLLTWENFALGRIATPTNASSLIPDPSSLVSAQLELRRNGDFITRSNDVECVYRRVIEPNPIVDPINPPDPDDPTKPLYPYGPVQNLAVIEETNAYCWVAIVVNSADAWVRFEGDGASNLADPSFAAKAGETNHVVILIGKTYKVTCDMPFTVVGKSDPDIDEWWEDDNTLWLNWPVDIWARGDDEEPSLLLMGFGSGSHRGNGFTMYVSPSGLGGGFNWTNSCCSVSGSGCYFSYNCNDDCHCRGCAASGYFSYEGYRLPAWGGSCGCSYEDEPDDPHDDDPDDPPVPVGVSASFSKRVIFFEDEYANTTNEVVPWHSEATELSCSAWGGEHGGYVLFSISGADNLIQYGGQPFPISRNLQPYETIAFTNVYRALSASSSANEIVITANFAENDTDWPDFAEDKATAVKVEIRAQVAAPENECINRHKFGVLENVDCLATPTTSDLIWKCSSGGRVSGSASRTVYKCPIHSQNNGLWIEGGGVSYTPSTLVVQPSGVVARNVGYQDKRLGPGHAGGILLTMTLHALPLDVSFLQTMIEEIPDVGGSHDGYFDDTCFISDWLHGDAQGAGEWGAVIGDNEFLSDRAGLDKEMYQLDDNGNVASNGTNGWVSGTLTWEVPCGWNDESVTKGDDPYGSFATSATQTMTIDANGNCQVIKHGNSVRREITGQKFLNGVLQ